MNSWIFLIPIISAFIGWFTNWIAIKMLFHPKEPKKILGITFHGIFPKRQRQFAEKLGILVSTELISFSEIEEKITNPENIKKLLEKSYRNTSGKVYQRKAYCLDRQNSRNTNLYQWCH